jgi:hypothetical protein
VASIGALAFGCNRPELATSPEVPRPPTPLTSIPFPDSVRVSQGLPPRVFDSPMRALGDTIIQTWMQVFPASAQQMMQLIVRVSVRDTSQSVLRGRSLPIDNCPVSLRIYRGVDRSAPPAWQSERTRPATRCPPLQSLSTSYTDVTAIWNVDAVLGDSLPAGRYAFAYTFRTTDGRTFEFSQSSALLTRDRTRPTQALSAVRFVAYSQIVDNGPRKLSTVVIARNTGTRAVQLSYGACNLNVRLYRNANRTGSPVWRSELRKPPGSKNGYACILPLYVAVLQPGDSLPFGAQVPMYEVVADSLPAGRYYVSAELSLVDEVGRANGPRMLSAGVVDITREPDRLPSSRDVDGLTFTATTRLVRGAAGVDTIRTLVLVTNTTNARRVASVSRDCPVIVYAYTSAALRDSVPLQTPISYPSRPTCYAYQHTYALDPGQSWVFGLDFPASAAPGSRHLWFTAWMSGTPYVILAAGDVEIPR